MTRRPEGTFDTGKTEHPRGTDPVCGRDLDLTHSAAAGLTLRHGGKTRYFCSHACMEAFEEDPGAHEG